MLRKCLASLCVICVLVGLVYALDSTVDAKPALEKPLIHIVPVGENGFLLQCAAHRRFFECQEEIRTQLEKLTSGREIIDLRVDISDNGHIRSATVMFKKK